MVANSSMLLIMISEDGNMIIAKIYEEQCEQEFVHQEQPNEDYFEGL